jgi:hypothetical protein
MFPSRYLPAIHSVISGNISELACQPSLGETLTLTQVPYEIADRLPDHLVDHDSQSPLAAFGLLLKRPQHCGSIDPRRSKD